MSIKNAEAAVITEVSGTGFGVYIPTYSLLGFQSVNFNGGYVYINVTVGNLNGSDCALAIYDNFQGYFTFTASEACTFYMNTTFGTVTFRKNGVIFSGSTSVAPSDTVTLSWDMTPMYTVVIQDGTYGTASPKGAFFEYEGYSLVITATPVNGSYLFNYWQVVGSNRLGQNPHTLIFTKSMTVYPVFKPVSGDTINPSLTFLLPIIAFVLVVGFAIVLISRRSDG